MIGRSSLRGAVNPLFQLVVFVLALAVLGVLAYRQITRIGAFTRPVVVAATPITDGTILEPQQLQLIRMRKRAAPEGALGAISDVEGRLLLEPKRPGEPITLSDLRFRKARQRENLADLVPSGRVLTTLTLSNLTIPGKELQLGDRIDILASGQTDAGQPLARVAVRDAYVIGHIRRRRPPPGSPENILGIDATPPQTQSTRQESALLLALWPDDVVPLAEVDASGLHITLVLHGTDTVRSNAMLDVGGDPAPKSVELIAGTERRKVFVQ